MRVEFAVEVFTDDAPLPPLVMLLDGIARGRHNWWADPASLAAAEIYFGLHAPRMVASYLELGRKGTVHSAWQSASEVSPATVRITLADLADLVEDLSRPAVLVVEDHVSDGCFVRALARVFAAERLLAALDRDWLVIRHGGGERLVSVAKAEREAFRRSVRVVTLLDSDRWLPDQQTHSHEKADQLRRHGVLTHVLTLREAENYLPNHVLHAAVARPSDASRRLDHLKQLDQRQRGYFDMKHGFRRTATGEPTVRDEQKELYADLDAGTVRVLSGGFGSHLLPLLERECARLTEQDFHKLGPAVVAELRELLSMINSVV
jgi:hypothetical protein